MKFIGALSVCFSSSSTAICLSVEKRFRTQKPNDILGSETKHVTSEHVRLLEGHSGIRSVELQKKAPQTLRSYLQYSESENLEIDSSTQIPKVVVLRVSLHCPGCAKKVRKHISKMEGVTGISIDLERKMVTVIGHVSPVGVLQSVCRVKNAELWPSSDTNTLTNA